MILPRNGRIVIVDDSMEDIKDFMEIFSKEGLSFSYFNGSVDTLPDAPLADTFLMFLDLELDGSAIGDDATQASQVISVIERILGDSAKDYSVVIIAWSKSLTILKELKPRMAAAGISPLAFFEMDKPACKTEGHFDINLIKAALEEKMSGIPAINLLYYWDNLAGKAAIDVYKKILPGKYFADSDLNIRLNTIYKELAAAAKGANVTSSDTYSTVSLLNSVLANEIGKYTTISFDLDVQNTTVLNVEDRGNINRSINMVTPANGFSPGCIIPNNIATTQFDLSDVIQSLDKAQEMTPHLLEEVQQVLCEVTPLCDHAQKRACFHRLIPGVLLPTTVQKKWLKAAEFHYITPIYYVPGVFNDKPFYIVFDLRRLCTIDFYPDGRQPDVMFKFGETLLMHLQNRLGRQVSNPGIVYV